MGRRPANADTTASERIDFAKRTLTIPNTTLPPFKLPAEEMTMAELFVFVRRARGAAELFPAPAAPSGADASKAGA